jgi:hypothetical protein
MASETSTPNIGLQVPAYNQSNWQVPINYDLNLLDLMLGGIIPIPALANFVITNIGAQIAAVAVSETPSGVVPGTVYTLSQTPAFVIAFYWNGIFQRPALDYTLSGAVITMTNNSTNTSDNVYVVYLAAS